MKKIILSVLVAGVVLIGVGVWFVYSNLDGIVERVIEQAGTNATGTQVSVESVEVALNEGRASIYGFAVANPEGFSDATMISFEELSVTLEAVDLGAGEVTIASVVAMNPRVLFELVGDTSNLQTVNDHLAAGAEEAEQTEAADPVVLSIRRVDIDDIEASLQSDRIEQDLEVNLGNIRLTDLEGTPSEIARQVAGQIMRQLSETAGRALAERAREALEGRAREELEQQVEDATDRIREGVGNLLDRD